MYRQALFNIIKLCHDYYPATFPANSQDFLQGLFSPLRTVSRQEKKIAPFVQSCMFLEIVVVRRGTRTRNDSLSNGERVKRDGRGAERQPLVT